MFKILMGAWNVDTISILDKMRSSIFLENNVSIFVWKAERLRHLPSTSLLLKCPQQTAVGQVEAWSLELNLDLTYVAETQELEPSSSASQEMK